MSVHLAARLRGQPSFSHLRGRFCIATANVAYGKVCLAEIVKLIAEREGALCRLCRTLSFRPVFLSGFSEFDALCLRCAERYGDFIRRSGQPKNSETGLFWLAWMLEKRPPWLLTQNNDPREDAWVLILEDKAKDRWARKHGCNRFYGGNFMGHDCARCYLGQLHFYPIFRKLRRDSRVSGRMIVPKWGAATKITVRGGRRYYKRVWR